MPLAHLDHFLIQTTDIDKTADWYVETLGMRIGPAPDFKFPVRWLYLGDTDVLHLTAGGSDVSDNRRKYLGQQSEATSGSGVVDHVAFRCTGLKEMIARFESLEMEFNQRQVSDQGLYQLFLIDPNGVKIELNFANAEAEGLTPEVMASDLAD